LLAEFVLHPAKSGTHCFGCVSGSVANHITDGTHGLTQDSFLLSVLLAQFLGLLQLVALIQRSQLLAERLLLGWMKNAVRCCNQAEAVCKSF
jgi:hypothetical protein